MTDDMVHSRKEGLVHSGLTASIPGGDEAGGAGHTPGPWAITSSLGDIHSQARNGKNWICQGPIHGAVTSPCPKEVEANARLIAAAPELLEAVRALKAAFGDPMTRRALGGHNERQMMAIMSASTAIAKAVGDVKRNAAPIHRRDGDAESGGVNQASLPSQSEVG